MNKRGNLLVGVMILAIVVIMAFVLIGPINTVINQQQERDNLNCPGYAYQGNSSSIRSYNASYETNELGCTLMPLVIPFWVLGMIIAVVTKIIYSKLMAPPQEEAYPAQYPGGYGGY